MRASTTVPSSPNRGANGSGSSDNRDDLAQAVRFYLQLNPRQLPSRFLYDTLGSALFDAICHLPWYRITHAELQLLRRHAGTIGRAFQGGRVVELGCGNGEKLATLLTHADVAGVHAHLIDLSEAALARSVQTLTANGGPAVNVTARRATYEDGLLALRTEDVHPTLVAFLGSNIGNFDPPGAAAFLGLIRGALGRRDHLLLGADLVKPERDLLLAYDDPLGLTAAFNKNLLLRAERRVERRLRLDTLRAPRGLECRGVTRGDASGQPRRPGRSRRGLRAHDRVRARRDHLDRELVQTNPTVFGCWWSTPDSSSAINGSMSARSLR